MRHDPEKSLEDIRDAAEFIFDVTRGRTLDEYRNDRVLSSAVERNFITVGEALNRLVRADPDASAALGKYPQIIASGTPWSTATIKSSTRLFGVSFKTKFQSCWPLFAKDWEIKKSEKQMCEGCVSSALVGLRVAHCSQSSGTGPSFALRPKGRRD